MWTARGLSKLRPATPLLAMRSSYTVRACTDDPGPRCARMSDPAKPPARDCTSIKRGNEIRKAKLSYVEMWADPECCRKNNCNTTLRYDDLYWKPVDKTDKKYMQTWVECPEPKLLPVVCKSPDFEFREPEKRTYKKRKVSKCDVHNDIGLMKCGLKEQEGCRKLKLAFCRPVAGKLSCKRRVIPTLRKKVCTQYPSFSECIRQPAPAGQQDQCGCLVLPIYCDILEALKKQEKMDKINKTEN